MLSGDYGDDPELEEDDEMRAPDECELEEDLEIDEEAEDTDEMNQKTQDMGERGDRTSKSDNYHAQIIAHNNGNLDKEIIETRQGTAAEVGRKGFRI